jgi:AraC-like DNA-binding protein
MSRKRQIATFDPLPADGAPVVTLARDYPPDHVIPLHFHDRDQLVFACRGVTTVTTDGGAWIVPVNRAVWIPEKVPHTIETSGVVAMRTLYVEPRLVESLPRRCCVIDVPPLLRELILQACALGGLSRQVPAESRLIDVILDQLRMIEQAPLQLSLPDDPRALRVAGALMADPADRRPLAQLSRASGASKRTIERLFLEQTGMTFGRWRQQLRLMHAIRLLGGGAKVAYAALEAGYSTPSAFIAAFRSAFGATPARYFSAPSGPSGRRDGVER